MKNAFDLKDTEEFINRINTLNADTPAKWGKMNVSQMLAHCNVSYELAFENIHKKPNPVMKLVLKFIVKKSIVNEAPYKQGLPTAPEFIIKDKKDFEKEKGRLINYIKKTQELGESHFDKKESTSFGVLTKTEWNNMFSKHLDHHLNQFGA